MKYTIEIKLKNEGILKIEDDSLEDIEQYSQNLQDIFLTQYIILLETVFKGAKRITQIRSSEVIAISIFQETPQLKDVVTMDE